MTNLLFHGHNELSSVLRTHSEKMRLEIASLPAERINGATENELIDHFVSTHTIDPLVIYVDRAEAQHKETQVDVSHDRFRRFIPDDSGPCYVKGDEVTIQVPFTGPSYLFQYTPSTRTFSPPRGRVISRGENAGVVSLTLALPSDSNDGDQFNSWIQDQLKGLTDYEGWIRADLTGFNNQLLQQAQSAIQARRQQLEKQGVLLKKLIIPVRPREDAPSPSPIPMPKRIIKPLPPASKVEQEYGICEADYEYILKIIRQESRSFETTPATFAIHDEEGLRDIVLAHLNGHFDGEATAERFRKKGKTDICIEFKGRAAFVAECKLWKGPKALSEAINQLLGYLTWRDTRTALIIWNTSNKEFAKLQINLPEILKAHPKYIRKSDSGSAGEWRAVFRSETDSGREVLVHVFLVDLTAPE